MVASYGLQGAVLAWAVTTLVARPRHAGQAVAVVLLAFLLVIVAPVTILTWRERALYFGYLNMESYASPTQALLKPLALLMFVFTARGLVDGGRLRDGLVLGSTTVLSALAKPTLHICLVPATIIMMAWGWLRGRRRHTIYLACAVDRARFRDTARPVFALLRFGRATHRVCASGSHGLLRDRARREVRDVDSPASDGSARLPPSDIRCIGDAAGLAAVCPRRGIYVPAR